MKSRINKGFIIQKVGGKVTIFDGEKSELITFNKVGSFIFYKIKLGWEAGRITKELTKLYSVSEKEAKEDVERFIENLVEEGVIS